MPKVPLALEGSHVQWSRARQVMPGGIHNAAYFTLPHPTFFQRAEGKYLFDVDGNAHLDMSSGHASLPLGNNVAEVNEAVYEAVRQGTFFWGMSPQIVDLASLLALHIPSVEHVLFTDSGSKATNLAVRLGRAF